MRKYLLAIVLVIVCFQFGNAQYTQKDSIFLVVNTQLDGVNHDWDSAQAILFRFDDIVDSTDLAKIDTGLYYAVHPPLSDSGSYWIEYRGWYADEATSWIYRFSVMDTLEMQGAASGLTKEQIAAAVRDTAENRPDIWTDQAAGSGSDTLQVWAKVGAVMYDDVMITVKNTSEAKIAWAQTEADGHITFNLDPATYKVYPSGGKVNWDSTYITSVVPSGGLIDTVTGTAFSPGAPGDANACSLYTWVTDLGVSNEIGGKLEWGFMSKQYRIQTTAGKYVSNRTRSATSDKDGYVGGQVYWASVLKAQDANGDAVDTVRIWVRFKPQGEGETFYKENWVVGDVTTYDLKNLFSY